MIRFVDNTMTQHDLMQVLDGGDLLHSCILATHDRARDVVADTRLWVCYDDREKPCAAVLALPDSFLLCDGGITELEELIRFLHFWNCRCLVGRRTLLAQMQSPLGLCAPSGAAVMVWRGGTCAFDAGIRRVYENFRSVYQLIRDNYEHFDNYGGGGDYNEWLSGLRLRERDGICALFVLCDDNGVLAAAGAITSVSGRCADIGGIVVRRDCRGKGIGARMVHGLTALAQRAGRMAVLACAEPALEKYYSSIGFIQCDEWAVCCPMDDVAGQVSQGI